MVTVLDADGRFLMATPAALRVLGSADGRPLIGSVCWELIPGLAESALGAAIRDVMSARHVREVNLPSVMFPGTYVVGRITPEPGNRIRCSFRRVPDRRKRLPTPGISLWLVAQSLVEYVA